MPRAIRAMRHLGQLPFVRDATAFGDTLHVLAEAGAGEMLRRDLEQSGYASPEVREIPATLEDVFVTLTRLRERERHRA